MNVTQWEVRAKAEVGLPFLSQEAIVIRNNLLLLSSGARSNLATPVSRRTSNRVYTGTRALCTNSLPMETAVARAWEHSGRIDIMVNNAGQAGDAIALPEKLPNDLFEQAVSVNLLEVWYCCREAGRRMLADGGGGSIINNASILD